MPSDPLSPFQIAGLTDAVVVGQGGFGQVFRAHQATFSRDVAVKVSLLPLHDAMSRLRFERECRAMGMLSNHPNIVTVYESGFTVEDLPYLIMEFLAQGSLGDAVDIRGALPIADVLAYGVLIAGALETAHRAGVLHRDIKPDNVLLSSFGEPKLGDFGLARLEDAPRTQSHLLSASLLHVAPELLEGAEPSPAGDLCSLGSTLYQLVAGQAPYWMPGEESITPLLVRTTSGPPPDLRPSGVPTEVCEVIERALARDPAGRPRSARELGEQLQAAQRALGLGVTRMVIEDDVGMIADVGEAAPPVAAPMSVPSDTYASPVEPAPARHGRRLVVLLTMGAVVLLAAVGLLLARGGGEDDPGVASGTTDPTRDAAADAPAETTEEGPSTTLDAAAAALDFGTARYDSEDLFPHCSDEPPTEFEAQIWQTSSGPPDSSGTPGGAPLGQAQTLGLRNQFGDVDEQRLDMTVEAFVLAPSGTVSTATVALTGNEFADVLYPDSFSPAPEPEAGTYTVIWRSEDGRHITCTGFTYR